MNVLLKNDQVKIILGIALFFNIAYQLSNSFALYYFKYVAERTYAMEGNGVLYPVYAGVAGFAQMGSMAILPFLSKKIGKKLSFFLASFLPVFGFALLWIMGYIMPTNVFMVGLCSAIVNCGIGFMLVFITVILSEVVDYGEYLFLHTYPLFEVVRLGRRCRADPGQRRPQDACVTGPLRWRLPRERHRARRSRRSAPGPRGRTRPRYPRQ